MPDYDNQTPLNRTIWKNVHLDTSKVDPEALSLYHNL